MEKIYIWTFNCSTSRPFQKGSVYKVLPIFEVCIFISQTELWKNTAPARRSCLPAHVEPFFHFQNSVDDHIWVFENGVCPKFMADVEIMLFCIKQAQCPIF